MDDLIFNINKNQPLPPLSQLVKDLRLHIKHKNHIQTLIQDAIQRKLITQPPTQSNVSQPSSQNPHLSACPNPAPSPIPDPPCQGNIPTIQNLLPDPNDTKIIHFRAPKKVLPNRSSKRIKIVPVPTYSDTTTLNEIDHDTFLNIRSYRQTRRAFVHQSFHISASKLVHLLERVEGKICNQLISGCVEEMGLILDSIAESIFQSEFI